jgi:16S rRNA processing protein RimM
MPAKPERANAHGMVAVARVAKPHGIRGELCMDIHAGSPLLFAPGRTLFLAAPNLKGGGLARPKPFEVAASRQHTGRMLVTLKGVPDRTAADLLRGAEVYIAEADLPPPDEGEEYLFRLLGARVYLEDGTEVGEFEAILDTPGQITWVIRANGPKGRGEEILFPAVPEFILGLDAKRKKIVIDPPPGLLELYLETPE